MISLAFAIVTYLGVWNFLRGDNLVSGVAERFDKSDTPKPVKRGDKEWRPLIRIITKYTRAELPYDQRPRVFARYPAGMSAKTEITKGKIIEEWAVPTTRVVLSYEDNEWRPYQDITSENHKIVGTIQDLHEWIRRDEADFDFLIRNIIFGMLSVCVGAFLALRS